MIPKQTIEQAEKNIREAVERLGLPGSDPEIDEAIKELAKALTPKDKSTSHIRD